MNLLTAESFAKAYTDIHAQHERFNAQIHFKRERFFNFLKANPLVATFDDVCFSVIDDNVGLDQYQIDFHMAPWERDLLHDVESVFFSAMSDDSHNFFILPFSYMEDPTEWERAALNTLAHYQSMVDDAYYSLAHHQRGNAKVSVRILRVEKRANSISAIVVRGDNTGLVLRDPKRGELVTNSFTIDRDTCDFIRRTLI